MWREMVSQLRGFVRKRIADPDRADDLVGEILLRIHQNVHSVDDRERLANWVFRVARNAVIDRQLVELHTARSAPASPPGLRPADHALPCHITLISSCGWSPRMPGPDRKGVPT
jgi:DNA-directed RNA polymerase specialized sigma24 family protein